jgi:putative oxidoreductase
MKQLLSVEHKYQVIDLALLGVRISIGVLMLVHGLPKLGMLMSGGQVQFPGIFGLSSELSLTLAVFAEVLCSVLIMVGLGTRLAVIPLIFTMLVAVILIHAADPFGMKELALLYLLVYVVLLASGSGRYSLDHLIHKSSTLKLQSA